MTKLFQRLLFFSIIVMLSGFFVSCDVQQSITESDDRITISNDVEILSERIQIINEPIGSAKVVTAAASNFTHLANVQPPTLKDRTLSATAVHISGDFAYVSYHINGEAYGGVLDMIDISDKNNPQIVSSITLADTDLNDVTISNSGNNVWVAGGRNVDASPHTYDKNGHKGAIAAEIEILNNQLTTRINEAPLPGFSGNAIEEYDNFLGVTTGSTGGIYILNKQDFSLVDSMGKDLAKHFDVEGNTGVGMALNTNEANEAKLYRYNTDTQQLDSLNTGTVVNPTNGKNVIDLRDDTVYAAMGDQGFKLFNFSQSSPLASFEINGNGLANGLDADANFLYMAAGSEGMYVANLPDLDGVFQWDNGQGSANYIESDGEFIFLAKGIDGLNILRRNDGNNAQPIACPFDASDGTVVEFQNNRIRSEKGKAEAQTDLANVNLTAGTYRVKLFGYDDHRNDNYDRQHQSQPNESFYISLLSNGSEVATTGDLGDLNDDNDLATRTEVIDNFELNSDADQIRAIHAAYPDNSSPNSMNAKCAAFKELN
jgi:hypothetical protein